ncbi:invasion associated locus B family protein [Brucellaceae bacterium C25G]
MTEGVSLNVDEEKVFKYALQTCNNNGCYLGHSLDKDLLTAIFKGNSLVLSMQDTVQNDIRLSSLLSGFSNAFASVK